MYSKSKLSCATIYVDSIRVAPSIISTHSSICTSLYLTLPNRLHLDPDCLIDFILLIKTSTMLGSANALTSPKLSISPVTIFRRIRRIIFPLRVMGKLGVTTITSGEANGPISFLTAFRSSRMSSSLSSWLLSSMTKEQIDCPLMGWGCPTTAAWATELRAPNKCGRWSN